MKYIIIQIAGGIGNQLFQLANVYHLSIDFGRELLICDTNSSPRNIYWDSILSKFKNKLISTEKYQEIKHKSQIYNWAMNRFEYKKIEFNNNIEYLCIEGYYQSYKYFDKSQFEEVLNFEGYPNIKNPTNNDVAIHIRRTDYTKNNFHKLLSINYYYNCLQLLREKININRIHIFSDDLNWCRQNFKLPDKFNNTTITINYVSLKDDIEELTFLSKFKNIIMANSSFSWWASHLDYEKIDKNIYCPKNWFNNGCHLNTNDLRPENWIIVDDDLPAIPLAVGKEGMGISESTVSPTFNVISLGSACCMVQNIHDNLYAKLGPLYRQPENATNFFDWLITDFKTISMVFENLMFRDDSFLCSENFTLNDVVITPNKLPGGWSNVYRKVEFKEGSMISLHDVNKNCAEIPNEFFEKYKRRFERLYNKIVNHNTIHLIHCFDFQWLPPYYPLVCEIEKVFESCKILNPMCDIKISFLVHPNYHPDKIQRNKERFKQYEYIENVEIFYLKDKGYRTDWKADNLTFDEFFISKFYAQNNYKKI